MQTTSRQIHLASRPNGWPTPDNFRLVEVPVPAAGPGEVVVRNTVLSVDPYMRGRMNDVKSYVPPFELDAPLDGGAVGEVIASEDPSLAVGDVVVHQLGWREHAHGPARGFRKVDADAAAPSAYLGVLGMPGLTAYAGLTRIGRLGKDDTVFVSGAAGAVGSVAGQVAKLLGAGTVIGSAGGPEKTAWLREIGFDVALDYKAEPIHRQLRQQPPVDLYFDNVGGDHLEAAISAMAQGGRIASCGMIAGYNADSPAPGPRNLMMFISKRLTMQGFIVSDHGDLAGEFRDQAVDWLASGRLTHRETFVDGIDQTVDAFLGVLTGANLGKMLVRL